ncbi:hypothetical protein BC940DRAFT_302773 [Gongronella butleri]|nr:hypothetical protein BC940DRAFT_302773 [Gongronella butleri]
MIKSLVFLFFMAFLTVESARHRTPPKKTPTGFFSCRCDGDLSVNIALATGVACNVASGFFFSDKNGIAQIAASCTVPEADQEKFKAGCTKFGIGSSCGSINRA